jgi:hypothetical protein
MRWVVKFLVFFIIIFFVNILFYFISSDYRFFLEKIKYPDSIVHEDDNIISDVEDILDNSHIIRVSEDTDFTSVVNNIHSPDVEKEEIVVKKEVIL